MKLYLGTHEPYWIGRSTVPLFASLERMSPRDRFPHRPALGGWALDSGGFSRLQQGGWNMSPMAYLEKVYELADRCPGMEWAAPQDWMCEPGAINATGRTVAEHQILTVENYCWLREIDERRLIIPVLQGWEPGDHLHCRDLYLAWGVDLATEPLVGVGTICRRQATSEIHGIIRDLAAEGLALHGFGVKVRGLNLYGELLTSCDSLAWSYRARSHALHGGGKLCETGTHCRCNNCFEWAHMWHSRIVNRDLDIEISETEIDDG